MDINKLKGKALKNKWKKMITSTPKVDQSKINDIVKNIKYEKDISDLSFNNLTDKAKEKIFKIFEKDLKEQAKEKLKLSRKYKIKQK